MNIPTPQEFNGQFVDSMHFVNVAGINQLILDKVAMDRVPGAIMHAKHMGGGGVCFHIRL